MYKKINVESIKIKMLKVYITLWKQYLKDSNTHENHAIREKSKIQNKHFQRKIKDLEQAFLEKGKTS